ncbi:MEDS domain-containing protein [Actinoplanes sp. NEAU-A12]|uniref:MEDS domain-containing protein n=1 Tax=Actinoplanes sandaracinus TaxID=3045177 RepID=A0ABT6WZF1_9ACTN|nr:MEDS domain-containing protein [Actinoplanes sandaracinus]MDI6105137.1 MEDS domain-containing protein [Actinoplanes sandaracinus]
MTGAIDHRAQGGFCHSLLAVDAPDTIERQLVPLLRRKINARQAVLMVVGAATEQTVRDRLGGDADALQWAPPDGFYQRLGFAYRSFGRLLDERCSRRQPVHLVAEPDLISAASAPVNRAAAFLGYEAMVNDVFARYGCPITCIWHSHHHPATVIDGVREVHGRQVTVEGEQDNPRYMAPATYLNAHAQATMTPTPPVTEIDGLVWEVGQLATCRADVVDWAGRHRFAPAAARQVAMAISEVVSNGLQHGRPPVHMRAWAYHDTLIVHIEDHGAQPIPADAGYRPPATPVDAGGLWVARQLADVLLTHTGHGRTAVRLYFPYAVTHHNLDIP